MPQIYLSNELYEAIIEQGRVPGEFVAEAVRKELKRSRRSR
jgi:hypothetical protein